ncbi:hypothetical protein ANTPLA_LOCUS1838 [Anthophora plagiata]
MAEYLNMIENGLAGFEDQDPDPERFAKVSKAVNYAIACYTIIYEEKKRTTRETTLKQLEIKECDKKQTWHLTDILIQHPKGTFG